MTKLIGLGRRFSYVLGEWIPGAESNREQWGSGPGTPLSSSGISVVVRKDQGLRDTCPFVGSERLESVEGHGFFSFPRFSFSPPSLV